MNNINKITESKMGFISILITMVCILGGLGITTIMASAAVTPGWAPDEAGMCKVGAKKVSDTLLASCKEKSHKNRKTLTNVSSDVTSTDAGVASGNSKTEVTHTSVKIVPQNTKCPASARVTLRSSVDASLMNAFEELGFEIHINPNSDYVGCFSTSKHTIEMRSTSIGAFRHEMGHFLDVLKSTASQSGEFASIYKNEKGNYAGANVAYVTKNAQEYFAQSYRNYLENKSQLKADRPLTYGFVQKQVTSISKEDINRMYNKYSWSW